MTEHTPEVAADETAPPIGEAEDPADTTRTAFEEHLADGERLLASYGGRIESTGGSQYRLFGVTDRQVIDYKAGTVNGRPQTTVRATALADVGHVDVSMEETVSTWNVGRLVLGIALAVLGLLGLVVSSQLSGDLAGIVAIVGLVLLLVGGYLAATAQDSESGGIVLTLGLAARDRSERYTLPESQQYVARQVVKAVGEASTPAGG